MGKFMKPGKVVLVLAWHYSGRETVIVKNTDNGTSDHPYKLCSGRWNWPLNPQSDSCNGQEENCQEVKDQVFCESL
jgi:hypothetical protein